MLGREPVCPAMEGAKMARVRIGPTGAATVGRLLRDIGSGRGVPADIRDHANYWAPSVQRRMERRDVAMIAWLLRTASASRGYSASKREMAHYWARYLESRM
jgi:hypothetical protein